MITASNKVKNTIAFATTVVLNVMVYTLLLYFTPRSNFNATYFSFVLLFAFYLFMIKQQKIFSFTNCIILGFGLRVLALFSMPALSDDYFRFIWDGKIFLTHQSPFAYTPSEFLSLHPDAYLNQLHAGMNSPEYYSVYPPVLQYIFALAAWVFPKNIYGSIVVMKLFILIAEGFTALILYRVLKKKNLDVRNMLWYVLNPLIIVELTGNLHFEALMICFLLCTLYFIESENVWLAAVCWSLAVCTKLLPLMLVPLFFMYLGFSKFFKMSIVAVCITIVLFIPMIDIATIANMGDSIGKFYNLFEFNGGIYYLFVKLASFFTREDISAQIASTLGLISFILILFISFKKFNKEKLVEKSMMIFFTYFLFAAMVHPWYISTMVALCVFTHYRFPVVFSALVLLSYFPYQLKEYEENMWIICLEYALLFLFLLYELGVIKVKQIAKS